MFRAGGVKIGAGQVAAFGQIGLVVAAPGQPDTRRCMLGAVVKAPDDGRNIRRHRFAGVHLHRQQEAKFPDMHMGVVEAGDQRAAFQIDPFDRGQRDQAVHVAHQVNASVVADQHQFGCRTRRIHRVNDTVVKQEHNRLDFACLP